MKFIFRGLLIIEYDEYTSRVKVYPEFNQCGFLPIDYWFIGEFFEKVNSHLIGSTVELNDIEIN